MKLRIKETGELLEDVKFIDTTLHKITIQYLDDGVLRECSIKNLSDIEEVKDCEEPKGIKDIYFMGATVYIEMCNQKEAIEVEEKLKAWKRLKDKGFRFDNWDLDADDEDVNVLLRSDKYKGNQVYALEEDLDLLFGGEE